MNQKSYALQEPTLYKLEGNESVVSPLFTFLRTLTHDKNVASIAPSSHYCALTICDQINFLQARNIVELGAGDGAITKYLMRRLRSDGRLLALDTNQQLLQILKSRIIDSRFCAVLESAEKLAHVAEQNQIRADVIVSGIPFSFFNTQSIKLILGQCSRVLAPHGKIIFYQAWLPPFATPRKLRQHLPDFFKITSEQTVYRNIPPLKIICAVH